MRIVFSVRYVRTTGHIEIIQSLKMLTEQNQPHVANENLTEKCASSSAHACARLAVEQVAPSADVTKF